MNALELIRQLLSSDTETEVLEFKEAKNSYSKDKLGKYFSALGNEANLRNRDRAYLLFGVNNQHEIIGTSISDAMLNEFKKEIADHSSPSLSFINVQRVQTDNGPVILFEIPAAPQGTPISWKGHRFGRSGESLGGLNDYEIAQILRQGNKEDWSAKIIKEATLEDLSQEAIEEARQQYAEKNPKLKETIEKWDDITFLNKAKICVNGKITKTAILLLGKPESEHHLSNTSAKITWILKDKDNLEKDYAHFSCPFLLEVNNLYSKIRNLKYRYIKDGSLFPDEVDQFDPYIIREALNNCIAHSDYSLGGKITVVEREDGVLTFVNSGNFIPESVEKVVEADAPEINYRNPWLANAMVNVNMIDTIGSGIKKMFIIQKNKFFPLPDYTFENKKVQVQITGKIVDLDYARKLAEKSSLTLREIIALDKVAKNKSLTENEVATLKSKKLIEGRKPNFHISSTIAKITGEKADYIRQKGLNDDFYEKLIIEYLKSFESATSGDLKKLLDNKFPAVLDENQKENKLRNMLQKMKRNKVIDVMANRKWKLV